MPIVPLISSVLFFVLDRVTTRDIGDWSRRLYHCGAATLICGMTYLGMMEIYGGESIWSNFFMIPAGILLGASLCSDITCLRKAQN